MLGQACHAAIIMRDLGLIIKCFFEFYSTGNVSHELLSWNRRAGDGCVGLDRVGVKVEPRHTLIPMRHIQAAPDESARNDAKMVEVCQ